LANPTVLEYDRKRVAATGGIVTSPDEWVTAQRLADGHWLYVVENAANQPPLNTVQNPTARFKPEEVLEIVRYAVKDWRNVLP
jgi:hypothetical protein